MAEQFVPTVAPTVANYRVEHLSLDWARANLAVVLLDSNGERMTFKYRGPAATTLMIALNKANLTLISLQARVLNQLAADGKIPAGSVTGTPD